MKKLLFAALTGLVLLGGIVGYNYHQDSNIKEEAKTECIEETKSVEYERTEEDMEEATQLKISYAKDTAEHTMTQSGQYYELVVNYLNKYINEHPEIVPTDVNWSFEVFTADELNDDGTLEMILVERYEGYDSVVQSGDADFEYMMNYLSEDC